MKTSIVPPLDRTRVFPGKVEAANKVALAFQVAGALTQLSIKKGQNVSKGEVLAQLDKRDYRSDFKADQAKRTRALADYKRAEKIFKKRLISAANVDSLRAARVVAAANVEKSRKALNDTTLRAPFSGTIATLYVDNFQNVRAKDPVLSLQDNSALDISVQVPENLIVHAGRQNHDIDLLARLEAYPDKAFPLSIKEFSTAADPDTQTFEFVLSMPAPTDINVLPGMSVSVEATPRAGSPDAEAPRRR
ncbi:MAG: efflux RND transporter periplasmic adaptor subunit [Motiliproteus sp.]